MIPPFPLSLRAKTWPEPELFRVKSAGATALCPGSTTTHCAAFGGASFSVKDTATNGTNFSVNVTDNGANDGDTAAGRICISNVPLGVAMTITETASNNVNYVKDSTTRSATQNSSGTCSGDSSVDVQTARNAGVFCCGVTYGFQPETLTNPVPDLLVGHMEQFADWVLGR